MKMITQSKQSGFTLVEIAIVLVIIGLLLGGVLKGQELITSAKVRGLNDRVTGISTAWYAFQDRYRAKPGDYNQASTKINATLSNGDGNGLVVTNAEHGQVWAHMEAAGLISGVYAGSASATSYNCLSSGPTAICPDNGFGRGMMIVYANEGQANSANANELITGSSIPVYILSELDRKVDDDRANTGNMQLGNGGGGWSAAASAACLNGNDYQVLTPSNDCAAVFRNL